MSEIFWKLNQKYICKMRLDQTWIRKRKFTLPCTTSHQIVINSSSALVILTQSCFWPSWAPIEFLQAILFVLMTIHISKQEPLVSFLPKSLKIRPHFDVNLFSTSFFKSQYNNKKIKTNFWHYSWFLSIFDITGACCNHYEYFLVKANTSENSVFYSW